MKHLLFYKEKREELIALDPKSAEIIRPILRGRDIKRYEYEFADLWLINTHNGSSTEDLPQIDVNNYPAVKSHLDNVYDLLVNRFDKGDTPYNLRSCAYMDDFYKQKIVWGNLSLSAQFSMAEEGIFISAPSSIIVPSSEYLLAILNSKLADFYIRTLGITRNGGYFEYKPMFIEQLPVPIVNEVTKQPFTDLVKQLLQIRKAGNNTNEIELQLDNLIFDLYQLSSVERAFLL